MKNAAQLWNEYHKASNAGNKELARQILSSLKGYTGNPPVTGGCVKCRRKMF